MTSTCFRELVLLRCNQTMLGFPDFETIFIGLVNGRSPVNFDMPVGETIGPHKATILSLARLFFA